jgi:hypothetical protein
MLDLGVLQYGKDEEASSACADTIKERVRTCEAIRLFGKDGIEAVLCPGPGAMMTLNCRCSAPTSEGSFCVDAKTDAFVTRPFLLR